MLTKNVPTKEEWVESLRLALEKTEKPLTDREAVEAGEKYDHVIEIFDRETPQLAELDPNLDIEVRLGNFVRVCSYQMLAEGFVTDLNAQRKGRFIPNMKFQNTTGWLVAFGVAFDIDRRDYSLNF